MIEHYGGSFEGILCVQCGRWCSFEPSDFAEIRRAHLNSPCPKCGSRHITLKGDEVERRIEHSKQQNEEGTA